MHMQPHMGAHSYGYSGLHSEAYTVGITLYTTTIGHAILVDVGHCNAVTVIVGIDIANTGAVSKYVA